MKTTTFSKMKTTEKQLPRARVMWGSKTGSVQRTSCYPRLNTHPVAVIPCRNAKQARALTKFFNLSEEEQADVIASAILDHDNTHYVVPCARAVLRRITGEGK